MSLDQRHLQLRQQLDSLGFNQPLPIGALGLVSALLDDLIQTTESLKDAKDEINLLLEAKGAWDLGVEPYKCDNARLLAEVNSLHLEMLKKQDAFELETASLRVKVRNLSYDNAEFEERNAEMAAKVRELEMRCSDTEKTRKNGLNYNRRPFCAAVRSSYIAPQSLDLRGVVPGQQSAPRCKCSCSNIRHNDVLVEIEKLQVEVKNQNELVEALKKQLGARDNEISRLSTLLNGGRPAAALSKDCCYRNVVKLSEDVDYLQAQKIELERKLSGRSVQESDVVRKMIRLTEINKKQEQDLRDIEKVALALESKANETVYEKDKEIIELRSLLKTAQTKVFELERGTYKYESSEYYNLKTALHDVTEEKRVLHKKLNEMKFSERTLKDEIHKLNLKLTKAKSKLSHENVDEMDQIRREKEFYFNEYSKLLETSRESLERAEKKHTIELGEKNLEIATLKSQLKETPRHDDRTPSLPISMLHCHSTQPSLHRVERERDVAVAFKEQALIERDRMFEKLNEAIDGLSRQQHQHRHVVDELQQQIQKLESSNRVLTASQRPNSATIDSLKNESSRLKDRIHALEDENSKLRTSNGQIKLLLEQVERSLAEFKEKATTSEQHLSHTEQVVQRFEKEQETRNCELTSLRSEVAALKTTRNSYDKERDRLIEDLDKKTEKIYQLESDLDVMRATKRGLEDTVSRLQIQLNSTHTENLQRQVTSKASTDEIDLLKRQMTTLKKSSDNALNENRRLANELADTVAELTKERQKTQKAVDDREQLKKEIQQYVLEVDRVNALLAGKESELYGMVESYQSASQDAKSLGQVKKQLSDETEQLRDELHAAEREINDLKDESKAKEDMIVSYERQISTMSSKITTLETENETLMSEMRKSEVTISEIRLEKEKLLMESNHLRERIHETERFMQTNSESSSLQELLTQKSNECERIRLSATQMSQEVVRLKCRIEELNARLDEEHAVAVKSEALAKEYKVQVQELRRLLTDDRFTQLRSIDEPNPYPTL